MELWQTIISSTQSEYTTGADGWIDEWWMKVQMRNALSFILNLCCLFSNINWRTGGISIGLELRHLSLVLIHCLDSSVLLCLLCPLDPFLRQRCLWVASALCCCYRHYRASSFLLVIYINPAILKYVFLMSTVLQLAVLLPTVCKPLWLFEVDSTQLGVLSKYYFGPTSSGLWGWEG